MVVQPLTNVICDSSKFSCEEISDKYEIFMGSFLMSVYNLRVNLMLIIQSWRAVISFHCSTSHADVYCQLAVRVMTDWSEIVQGNDILQIKQTIHSKQTLLYLFRRVPSYWREVRKLLGWEMNKERVTTEEIAVQAYFGRASAHFRISPPSSIQ